MLTDTIAEPKERELELVEINRALAQDLDTSRRLLAELGRERDALRQRVAELTHLALERDESVAALNEIRCQLLELPDSFLQSEMR